MDIKPRVLNTYCILSENIGLSENVYQGSNL